MTRVLLKKGANKREMWWRKEAFFFLSLENSKKKHKRKGEEGIDQMGVQNCFLGGCG